MGIDVTFVLADTYKDWPRIRRVPKNAHFGVCFVRAHWLSWLAGPVQEIAAREKRDNIRAAGCTRQPHRQTETKLTAK